MRASFVSDYKKKIFVLRMRSLEGSGFARWHFCSRLAPTASAGTVAFYDF